MARVSKYITDNIKFSHSVDDEPIDSDYPLHVHDDYELYCLVEGNVEYVVEGRVYEMRPGTLMIMRSAEIHKLVVRGGGRYERYTLNFIPELLFAHGFDREENSEPHGKEDRGEDHCKYKEYHRLKRDP